MYCENCGRELKDGDICRCRRKVRTGINGSALFSILMLIIGMSLITYLNIYLEKILTLLPVKIVSDFREIWLSAVPLIIFLIGVLTGIAAARKRSVKIISILAIVLNLCGVIITGTMTATMTYQNFQVLQLCSGELTENDRSKLKAIYAGVEENTALKEKIETLLKERIEEIEEAYNNGQTSIEDAEDEIYFIEEFEIDNIYGSVRASREFLGLLQESKAQFINASEYEQDDLTFIQAIECYENVIEEDTNYIVAQERIKEIDEKISTLISAGITNESIDVQAAWYPFLDTDMQQKINANVLKYAEEIRNSLEQGEISCEEASGRLIQLEKFTVYGEEIQHVKDYVENMVHSGEAWNQAAELEKNPETVLEAVRWYQEVTVEDKKYEEAQERIRVLLNSMKEDWLIQVEDLVEKDQYQDAIALLDGCLQISPEDENLSLLRAECIMEYSSYALQEAEQLLELQLYDEAKDVLEIAFQVTGNLDVQTKLDTVDEYRPVSLGELHSIDSHDVAVQEQLTDSYGNSHTDVIHLDASDDARAVYQLDGKYSSLTGNLVCSQETASDAVMDFAIFADDELVYSALDVTKQQGAKEISLDLSGVRRLEIQTKGNGVGYWERWMYLTECVLQKNMEAIEAKQKYERLIDTVVIDQDEMTGMSRKLLLDSYGVPHNGYTKLSADINTDGYILFNLNQKYVNFSGKIVTSSSTRSDDVITVVILADGMPVFEQSGIDKTVEHVPFSLNIEGVKVLEIVTTSKAASGWHETCYLVDDKLYFEHADVPAGVLESNIIASYDTQIKDVSQEEIHRYDYFLMDGTWEDAYRACLERGGHLVTIDSREEFDYIATDLLNKSMQDYLFYIGGRRDLDSEAYYWVDIMNSTGGEMLNAPDSWYNFCWLDGEPTFWDSSLGIAEHVLNMFYYDDIGQWVMNDIPNDLLNAVSYYKGTIGYICEYEN